MCTSVKRERLHSCIKLPHWNWKCWPLRIMITHDLGMWQVYIHAYIICDLLYWENQSDAINWKFSWGLYKKGVFITRRKLSFFSTCWYTMFILLCLHVKYLTKHYQLIWWIKYKCQFSGSFYATWVYRNAHNSACGRDYHLLKLSPISLGTHRALDSLVPRPLPALSPGHSQPFNIAWACFSHATLKSWGTNRI